MEETTGLWILGTLITVFAIVNIFGFIALAGQEVKATVDLTEQNTAIDKLTTSIDKLAEEETEENVSVVDSNYILNKGEYEDEVTEAKALEMALAELDSRDFKKAVWKVLINDSGNSTVEVDIDSYKDITKVKVIDSDVDVDDTEVEFNVKIYYFLDGDEDEDERARLEKFTITIVDLDFDDEFEDAEVDEDYLDELEVKKIYS